MKASLFRSAVDSVAMAERMSVFTTETLARAVMRGESPKAVAKTLAAAVKDGVLVRLCRGLYAYEPALRLFKGSLLEEAVVRLRPRCFSYVSLETALSYWGVISQQTLGALTVMSTGRSQTFRTPYGAIDVTHTARKPAALMAGMVFPETGHGRLPYAGPRLGAADLRRVGRNLDLVAWEEIPAAECERAS